VSDQDFREHIEVDSEVHFGKPCVKGTRFPVSDVLELVEQGIAFQTITKDYFPGVTTEDIQACLRYAREVIEAEDIHLKAS